MNRLLLENLTTFSPFSLFRSTTKKRPAKKRTSGWARGVDSSRKRKKVNHLENGNVAEKSVNGVSGDEDKDHSNNEMSGDEVHTFFTIVVMLLNMTYLLV